MTAGEPAVDGIAEAIEGLKAAVAAAPDPASHELLAGLLMADDDLDGARLHAEAAFALWREAGEPKRAARVAAQLGGLHHAGFQNHAAGQGWLGRARRLLEPHRPCVEEGYVELAFVACTVDDVDELRRAADHALALAIEFGDPDLEVRALADGGYALVAQGHHAEGFSRLDEAMAALSAGEVADPGIAAVSYCALLTACDRAGDSTRAEEWTRLIGDRLLAPMGQRPRVLHTHCRLAYGSVLCTAGRWDEGERSLLEALGPDATAYLWHRAEAAARLASLRLLQGRVEEAAELLRPYEDRIDSVEPLARLHLVRHDHDIAAAVAERALGANAGDLLRQSTLRSLLVEIELGRDAVDTAAAHATALAGLAASCDSPAVHAESALARARVALARLDAPAAHAALAEAATALEKGDRPLLSGIVCLEQAQALADAGDTAAAVVPARSALATFERLGAKVLADRTDALLRSLGEHARTATRRPDTAVAGLTAREREVLALVKEGLTNPEIGARLYISTKTAEHHVGRVLGKLGVRSRAEAAAVAAAGSH
jgi:DNA-binding CsgD family transcriptional regulator